MIDVLRMRADEKIVGDEAPLPVCQLSKQDLCRKLCFDVMSAFRGQESL